VTEKKRDVRGHPTPSLDGVSREYTISVRPRDIMAARRDRVEQSRAAAAKKGRK
jgi:hypothetical protein